MHSARVRRPQSGRVGVGTASPSVPVLRRTSSLNFGLSQAITTTNPASTNIEGVETLLLRPFTPENHALTERRVQPKFISTHVFDDPTLREAAEAPPHTTWKRPLICPPGFIEANQSPPRPALRTQHDEVWQRDAAAAFVRRNFRHITMLDASFTGKGESECVALLMNHDNFLMNMRRLSALERSYHLGTSSSQARLAMVDAVENESRPSTTAAQQRQSFALKRNASSIIMRDDGYTEEPVRRPPLKPPRPPPCQVDPFIASVSTAREARVQRLETMFAPSAAQREQRFNIPKGTLPEYGSFSGYLSNLKRNESSILQR